MPSGWIFLSFLSRVLSPHTCWGTGFKSVASTWLSGASKMPSSPCDTPTALVGLAEDLQEICATLAQQLEASWDTRGHLR